MSLRPITDEERPAWQAFGAQLAAFRNGAGASQVKLAVAVELSPSHINHLEHGQRRTRRSTIRRLAEALAGLAPAVFPDGADDLEDALRYALKDHGQEPAPESKYAGHDDRMKRWAEARERKAMMTAAYLEKHAAETARQARAIAADDRLLAEAMKERLRAQSIPNTEDVDPYSKAYKKMEQAARARLKGGTGGSSSNRHRRRTGSR